MKKIIISSVVSIVCLATTIQANVISGHVLIKLIVPQVATDVPTFVDGAPLAEVYVKTVGSMAYLWAWTMIDMNSRE